ncbi:MAG: hypothetical protein C4519_21310 [Desulfobacteraceae bacterium]|nr:MAG: hypothetical protein C4519_21310 [Desulfobacteraceae bacterium]
MIIHNILAFLKASPVRPARLPARPSWGLVIDLVESRRVIYRKPNMGQGGANSGHFPREDSQIHPMSAVAAISIEAEMELKGC